ncbi:MAG: PilZ domain-containing protein [Planctomycetota bacterium]
MTNLETAEAIDFSEFLGDHLAMRSLLPKRAEKQDSRRRHARFNCKQYAEVIPLSSALVQIGKPVVVYATDVSIGGMGFVSSNQVPADFFYVKLRVSQQSVHCIAQILRRQVAGIALFNHAFGCRFIDRVPTLAP